MKNHLQLDFYVGNTMEESLTHGTEDFNFEMYDNIAKYPTDALFVAHWHREYEINYVIDGTLEFILDGDNFEITSGQAIIIDRFRLHSCRVKNHGNSRCVSIVFGESIVMSDPNDLICKRYFMPLLLCKLRPPVLLKGIKNWEIEILDVIKDVIMCALKKDIAYELDIKINFLKLFGVLVKNNAFEDIKLHKKTTFFQVKEALNFIHQNYKNDIKIIEIASSANLSQEHFIRSFKTLTGRTPKNYLIHYRIERAKALISTGEKNLSEIASECGFSDICYLSRCFKKYAGTSPSNYRKSLE